MMFDSVSMIMSSGSEEWKYDANLENIFVVEVIYINVLLLIHRKITPYIYTFEHAQRRHFYMSCFKFIK